MDPAEVHICFYHGNCHDGALAAAIVKQKTNAACEFVPTWWDSLPVKPAVAGKNVLFVDLTPSPKVLAEVLAKAVLEYAESYFSELDFYRSSLVNRGSHYPYLRRISRCQDNIDAVKQVLGV